ncbi:MAG: beta-galactosidase [Solirubrobacteraceae bacterium]|nr:beta-galactosidase [Solirubrobacteraceae bacterium]
MVRSVRRVLSITPALAAVAAVGLAAGGLPGGSTATAPAGAAATGAPTALAAQAPVDPAHPPQAASGPDGRIALDGEWVERRDAADRGEALGWPRGTFPGRAVRVPYSPNAATVRGDAGLRSHNGTVAWYRTTFTVAADGDYAVRFESVNHEATVWVDGRVAARHTGVYLPFDVALHLGPGDHSLVVRADWRGPAQMKAAGWHRTWFNFGGINREVTLRPLAASELDGPGIVTRLSGGGASVAVSVNVHNRAGARTVQVHGTLGGQALVFPPVSIGADERRDVRAVARIQRPDLWAPGHPALADLHLEVPRESGWSGRVGLRELSWTGGRLRLNGAPLRLRGASLQEDAEGRGDALQPSDMDAIVQRLQAIGANATRAQHALNPALLERLDAAGILVWQGIGPVDAPGNWTSDTPAERRRAIDRDRTSVTQARIHPSVLAWNLGNEVARNGHTGGQAGYIDTAAQMLHQMDPGRPVAVDVWGSALPPDASGLLYRHLDLIGVTLYEGWYQRPGEPVSAIGVNLRRRLAQIHRIFARRPVVVTEFGAEANRQNASGRPGGEAYQARVLERNIRSFNADRALDGWLVWAIQDFAVIPTFQGGSIRRTLPNLKLVRGVNQKGLFTYGGAAKPSVAVVRRVATAR